MDSGVITGMEWERKNEERAGGGGERDGRGGDCAILLFFFKRKTHEQKGLYFSSAKVSERGAFGQ